MVKPAVCVLSSFYPPGSTLMHVNVACNLISNESRDVMVLLNFSVGGHEFVEKLLPSTV